MNLEKAIEILELNIREAGKHMPPDCKNALELGVQALKAVGNLRVADLYTIIPRLPGETNDNGGH